VSLAYLLSGHAYQRLTKWLVCCNEISLRMD
jgi:hypothetical protein